MANIYNGAVGGLEMNDMLAKNIAKFRKKLGFTQEGLAEKLHISAQAVSKWETGQTQPDISLVHELAVILDTDINALLGYVYNRRVSIYEDEYRQEEYYWGLKPGFMCYRVLEFLPPIKPLRLLDIGCGEGKDAVFFARNGYIVTGIDIADAGIDKTKRLAEQYNVHVNTIKTNIMDFRLDAEFDVIYSTGVLHYVPPELRNEIFDNYKNNTSAGGLHMLNVFVKKPFILPAPEKESNAYNWVSGELFTHYSDWNIRNCEETIFDCNSAGVSHKHCINTIAAEKTNEIL
jgi:tellurite methyltransferase